MLGFTHTSPALASGLLNSSSSLVSQQWSHRYFNHRQRSNICSVQEKRVAPVLLRMTNRSKDVQLRSVVVLSV